MSGRRRKTAPDIPANLHEQVRQLQVLLERLDARVASPEFAEQPAPARRAVKLMRDQTIGSLVLIKSLCSAAARGVGRARSGCKPETPRAGQIGGLA